MSWVKVATIEQLNPGSMKQVVVEEQDIALYHVDDAFYATSDVCTHASETLTRGTLSGCIVACPKHGGKFDVRSGGAVAFPCVIPVETYAVEIRGSDIYIDFEE